MDAHDFARPNNQEDGKKVYNFGVDPKAWSTILREIADAIDDGDIGPQQATIYTRADMEDFTMTTVILKFAEKIDMKEREEQKKISKVEKVLDHGPRVKKLWVGCEGLPVDIATVK